MRECENLYNQLQIVSIPAIEVHEEPAHSTTRIQTDSKVTLNSHLRDKSLVRDKSVGRNLGKTEEKTMIKTKTVSHLKKTEVKDLKNDLKTSISKTKSTLSLNKVESSKSRI
jgi:hypothetical protein